MSADDGRDDGRDTEIAAGTNGESNGESNGEAGKTPKTGETNGGTAGETADEGAATQNDQGVSTPPPLVRRPLPVRPPANPALLGPTAEELAADQPSVETLRRVRHALRALPEPD